ncbi:SMP-30/gluconolactonase/LRE family protein [Flavitalea flava]
MTASLLVPCKNILGEGPLWHAERNSIFWVDIESYYLYEYSFDRKNVQSWTFDVHVSAVLQGEGNGLILGMKGGLARFDLESGHLDWLMDIDKDLIRHRCNDGACDSKGRLWIGTMDMNEDRQYGSLYCVSAGEKGQIPKPDSLPVLQKKLDNVRISNGIAWSPDNKRMYFIDTARCSVEVFHFDEQTGNIRFEKEAIRVPAEYGKPDGMAMDAEGMIWTGNSMGSGVYRWNPLTGELLGIIKLPAPNITSCAFVGKDLDQLVITTARENLSEEELERYPHSGGLFIANPGVKGLPVYKCGI